jgi:hypothetical protein
MTGLIAVSWVSFNLPPVWRTATSNQITARQSLTNGD